MTRVVVFSDVHGNTFALDAFLDACISLSADIIVNLGDVASGGLDPRGTLDRLKQRPDIITIRGNHDRQLVTRATHTPGGSDWLAAQVLTKSDRAWLTNLALRAEVMPGMLAFHGAPDDDLIYLLESAEPTAPNGARKATDKEVWARLGTWVGTASLFLCGHSHMQRSRLMPDGTLIVNPGSLGWPVYSDDDLAGQVQTDPPRAQFAVLDQDAAVPAGWRVTLHTLDYPIEQAAALARRNGRDDIAHTLLTGRVTPPTPR